MGWIKVSVLVTELQVTSLKKKVCRSDKAASRHPTFSFNLLGRLAEPCRKAQRFSDLQLVEV